MFFVMIDFWHFGSLVDVPFRLQERYVDEAVYLKYECVIISEM